MKKAIDVSKYQGLIDWDAVKADGVEFAVIRGGLGDDLYKQDDEQFERNWTECQRVGIQCTMYFFTYAAAKGGDITGELNHIRRLMKGKKMNCTAPIYIDVENTSGLDWRKISNGEMLEIMKNFKAGLKKLGFDMGIYSSRSAFWNEKMTDPWYEQNVSIWVAEYASKVNKFTRPYDLWQYSSSGSVKGISGRVDMDWLYADFSIPAPGPVEIPVHVTYQAHIGGRLFGRWLPNVTDKSDYAGNIGTPITGVYVNAGFGDVIYKVGLLNGAWLPEVKNREDYAGIYGKPIDRIMVKSTIGATVHVQAHTVNGKWLPAVTGYNEKDARNGYAGIKGKAIDAIYIWADPIKK